MRQKTVHFVSARAGAGKTHWLRNVLQCERGLFNHLYLANNGDLIDEMKAELQQMGLTVDVITTDTHPKGVKKAAIEYHKQCKGVGHILLMTHQAYAMDIPIPSPERWKLWIDELPQFSRGHGFRLPKHMHYLTDHIEIADFNEGASRVHGRSSLRKIVEDGFLDDVLATFQKFFLDAYSGMFDVFVHTEGWKKAVGSLAEKDRSTCIRFISVPNPRYFGKFAQVTILGANFRDSLIHQYLKEKVRFVPHPDFVQQPRPSKRPISDRVKIHYLLESDLFSKNLSQKPYGDGTVLDRMERLIVEKFGDAEFLYAVNTDRERRTALKRLKKAKQIPANAVGVNFLSGYHAVAYLAAVNPHPVIGTILKCIGLSRETVTRAIAHEWVYQAVMRCSARDPQSEHDVIVIVPDLGTAERLAFLLEIASVEKLGDIAFDHDERDLPFSDAEKKLRSRAKMRVQKLRDRVSSPSSYKEALGDVSRSSTGDELYDHLIHGLGQLPSIILTHQHDLYSHRHEEFEVFHLSDFLELKKFIKEQHDVPCDKKECRTMYNLSYFGQPQPGEDHYRTQKNFRCATALVMDIDGGNLSPEQFCEVFGDDPGQPALAFFLYSSFSYRTGNNRFHAVLPLKKPIASIENFKIVYRYLLRRIHEAGYDLVEAKVDLSFLSGIQSAFMPGRDRRSADAPLFVERRCERTRDLKRYALDPEAIVMTERLAEKLPARRSHGAYRADPDRIEALKDVVHRLCEGRRTPFYRLGWQLLLGCGLPLEEVEQHLREVITADKMCDWLKDNMEEYETGNWSWRRLNKNGDRIAAPPSIKIIDQGSSKGIRKHSKTRLPPIYRYLPAWLPRSHGA